MNNPSSELMKKNPKANLKNAREHVFHNRVASLNPLLNCVQYLPPFQNLILNFMQKRQKRSKHLFKDVESEKQTRDSQSAIFQELMFNKKKMLLINPEKFVHSRTKSFQIHTIGMLIFFNFIVSTCFARQIVFFYIKSVFFSLFLISKL